MKTFRTRTYMLGTVAVLLMAFLTFGCAADSNQKNPEGFRFTKVINGGRTQILAVDSEGRIWEANPQREQGYEYVDWTYSSDPATWENVVDADVGQGSVLALIDDGTVKYGNIPFDDLNPDALYPLYDLSDWEDITAIACGIFHVVGLRGDGSVVVASEDAFYGHDPMLIDFSTWSDIVGIAAGQDTTFGLRSDGTVVASNTIYLSSRKGIHSTIDDWTDITAIDAGLRIVAGLRSDGTVLIGGISDIGYGAEEIATWTGITEISTSYLLTAGLTEQGTVLLVSNTQRGAAGAETVKQQVQAWTDVVAVDVFRQEYVVTGLKSDGTILLAIDPGYEYSEVLQEKVAQWNALLKQP